MPAHLHERLVSVVLFGSVARGDASPASDTTWYWDLKPDFQPGDVVEI